MKQSVRLSVNFGVVITLALALWIGSGKAARINGRLVNQDNSRPIVGATIVIEQHGARAVTDSSGRFTFNNVPDGEHTIRIIHSDFGSKELTGVRISSEELSLTISASDQFQVWEFANQLKEEEFARTDAALDNPSISLLDAVRVDLPKENQEGTYDYAPEPNGDSKKGKSSGKPADQRGRRKVISGNEKRSDAVRATKGLVAQHERPRPPVTQPLPYGNIPGSEYGYPRNNSPRDMFFQDYGTNRFVETARDRFSTFAVDVDDASYGIAARYIRDGHLPPTAAIRAEEFINHFDYGYNSPKSGTFRVFTEVTQSPFNGSTSILKIGIKGKEIESARRKPLRLTLVIDVSGSMSGGNRLELAKESLRMLVKRLDSRDMIGIVKYNTSAFHVLEPISASRSGDIERAISSLYPGGSTNAEAGLTLGFQMANRHYNSEYMNRVVLVSDGVANVGNTSSGGIMSRLEGFARRGITLSAYGVGMGNYNDVLLEQLAQKGDGNYAYINNRDDAAKLFVDEIIDNFQLLARDTKVQVEFNPSVVASYRLVGYENRAVADSRFRDNNQDGGEVGPGHEVTAVYELVLASERSKGRLATVHVRWTNPGETQVSELSRDATISKDWKDPGSIRPELRLALVATRFSELLKRSSYASETGYNDLIRVAEPLSRQLGGKQVDDLLDLIRRARDLSTFHTMIDDDNYIREF